MCVGDERCRVRTETSAGLDPVFVDYPERTEALMPRVIVRREGEGVVCVQPIVICMSALRPTALGDLHRSWNCSRHCAYGGFGNNSRKEDTAKGA
jgi:hypothetical protein